MPWPLSSKSRTDSVSADPQIRQFENVVASEAKGDQKTLEHAIKDLANADKTHSKSINVCSIVLHSVTHPLAD